MKKILIISTVSRQFHLFERVNIKILKSLGFEVHGAASFSDRSPLLDELGILEHEITLTRFPITLSNIKALFQLKKIIKDNNINAVHCHSPSGGLIGRLAAKMAGVENIYYTAHGFHFFKGASLVNWLVFFPVEYLLSFITTKLFVINEEDYKLSSKVFHARETVFVPGIGINLDKFIGANGNSIRNELGISDSKVVVSSIGEFIDRKNYPTAIEAFSRMENKDAVLLLCGIGVLQQEMKSLCKRLNICDRVHFLGYRKDIVDILAGSDIFIFTSKQEGLPVSVMEAMASGLPVVCSGIRGNTDLIEDGVNGYLCASSDVTKFQIHLDELVTNIDIRRRFRTANLVKIQNFSADAVQHVMYAHYKQL